MRGCVVGGVVGLGCPAFVEEEFGGIVGGYVEIVEETAGLLARGGEDLGEGFSQFRFLSGAGLKGDGHDDGFWVHVGFSDGANGWLF